MDGSASRQGQPTGPWDHIAGFGVACQERLQGSVFIVLHVLRDERGERGGLNELHTYKYTQRAYAGPPPNCGVPAELAIGLEGVCSCNIGSFGPLSGWTPAENLTETGGEGAVVKPLQFVATTSRGLLQPAVKTRGPEYLRIIYGAEYTLPEHLERLRERGLSGKRSLAQRERYAPC